MAVAFLFENPGMTQEQYDQVVETLQRDGKTAQGRLFHLAGPMEGGWRVLEVWESQEAWDKFLRETLGPLLQGAGAPPPHQQLWPVHNSLSGPEHHL
jgi:hypothetical protein